MGPAGASSGLEDQGTESGVVEVWHGAWMLYEKQATLDQSGSGALEVGDEFGYALAAGNFDGGAHDDLAAGAPSERPESRMSGIVYLFRGSSSSLVP